MNLILRPERLRPADGGRRGEIGEPDPKTWINLFAGGDTASGRNP